MLDLMPESKNYLLKRLSYLKYEKFNKIFGKIIIFF